MLSLCAHRNAFKPKKKVYPIQMPRESPSAVYCIDAVVGILLLVAGILIVVIGIDLLSVLKTTYGAVTITYPTYITASAWLTIVLGFAGIIYGAKRTIDDVAKGIQPRE